MSPYKCTLCPRNCKAERTDVSGSGYCRMGMMPRIARIAPHFWEEPCVSGTRGSGTVFFSGCVLGCVFCQNYVISKEDRGKVMTEDELLERIKELEQTGVHNINLVSPTPYIETVINVFERYRPSVPIVYNTGGYEKVSTLRRLEGIVDIYLPDFKYARNESAKKYSGAENYPETALEAIREMVRQTGAPCIDDEGIMRSGTIVRHLILPAQTRNSVAVLDILKKEFDRNILVSLMGQYLPLGRAGEYKEINRRITPREYDKVLMHFEELELDGYAQELSSAKESYVPDFDMTD